MISRPTAAALLLLLPVTPPAAQHPALSDLAWLAGSRRTTGTTGFAEERWTEPASNMMLGLSRTLRGDRVVEFEFLRIEARSDGIYYVAQPGGKPPTLFKLTSWNGTEAIFSNPEHDFPKRVIYRKLDGGAVLARIDGGAGDPKGQEWVFR